MFEFAWPWLWLLAPLPLLVRFFAPATSIASSNALSIPFIDRIERAVGNDGAIVPRHHKVIFFTALISWWLFLAAAAQPQWLGKPIPQQLQGRDLVLAVDLSESMLEKDFEFQGQLINRLVATRLVAGDFIERRQGDRVGLILFAEQAYSQAPLTHDRKTVKALLDEAQIGLAGKSTAIGDAIGLAVKRFDQMESKQRILVLLTDGANTAGVLQPMEAAELAASEGLKIYTIGVGGDGQQRGLLGSFFSTRSDIDEKTLTAIAKTTGGQYFRARDIRQLAEIYELLDQLEPVKQDDDFFRPVEPLYIWPLMAGFFMCIILIAVQRRLN